MLISFGTPPAFGPGPRCASFPPGPASHLLPASTHPVHRQQHLLVEQPALGCMSVCVLQPSFSTWHLHVQHRPSCAIV